MKSQLLIFFHRNNLNKQKSTNHNNESVSLLFNTVTYYFGFCLLAKYEKSDNRMRIATKTGRVLWIVGTKTKQLTETRNRIRISVCMFCNVRNKTIVTRNWYGSLKLMNGHEEFETNIFVVSHNYVVVTKIAGLSLIYIYLSCWFQVVVEDSPVYKTGCEG